MDRIASREVSVQYCPTENMSADFFTKPFQGAVFKKFRDQIKKVDPTNSSLQDHRSVLENVESDSSDYNGGTECIHMTKKNVSFQKAKALLLVLQKIY